MGENDYDRSPKAMPDAAAILDTDSADQPLDLSLIGGLFLAGGSFVAGAAIAVGSDIASTITGVVADKIVSGIVDISIGLIHDGIDYTFKTIGDASMGLIDDLKRGAQDTFGSVLDVVTLDAFDFDQRGASSNLPLLGLGRQLNLQTSTPKNPYVNPNRNPRDGNGGGGGNNEFTGANGTSYVIIKKKTLNKMQRQLKSLRKATRRRGRSRSRDDVQDARITGLERSRR